MRELHVRQEAQVGAAFGFGHRQLVHRPDEGVQYVTHMARATVRGHLVEQCQAEGIHFLRAVDQQLADQFVLRSEVVLQRSLVALPGRRNDIGHRDAVDAVLREQALCNGLHPNLRFPSVRAHGFQC